ncbi:MAG: hypothetical protein KDA28_03930, partial [Phycisphaerales bacterium]|nr:hypothetical protein [Phycisphaerales bacterium]
LHHPERIPEPDAGRIRSAVPARIAYVKGLLPPDRPLTYSIGPAYACDGSGTTFTVSDERAELGDEADSVAVCNVDLRKVGVLRDIVSNALRRGLRQPESRVASFLRRADERFATSDALLEAVAHEFDLDRSVLDASVGEFRLCNCGHGPLAEEKAEDAATTARPSTSPSAPVDTTSDAGVHGVLRVIAVLLGALLVVNVATLVVLVRRSPVA